MKRPGIESVHSDRLYAKQVKLLYESAPLAYSVTLINGGILVYVQGAYFPNSILLGWYGCLLFITVVRAVVAWRYDRIRPGLDQTRFWNIAYVVGAGAAGSVWGAAALVLFPMESIAHQVFVAFTLAGMAAGGISVLAPRMEACLAFLLPGLLPLAIRYLTLHTTLQTVMGVMTLIFLVGITLSARNFHRVISMCLALRFDKQELERHVEERTRSLAQSNEKLEQEVEQRRQTEASLHATEARLAADLTGMSRLYELRATLTTETDLHAGLDEILAIACEFTGADRGCVHLVSDDGERLEMVAQRGYGPDSPFTNHFRYQGFGQGCEVARRRLLIEDTTTFPGLVGTAHGAAMLADGIHAAQSMPMVSGKGETVGALNTQFRQPHCPSDDELRLIDLLAWTAADFVERHHAEAALRESEARFRALADASPALIWQVDPDGNAIYLNQRYLDVTGLTPEQLLTTGWHSIVHPEDLPSYLATFKTALGQRTSAHSRVRAKAKDGQWHWFETYAAPWFSAAGEYRGHVGISVDITEAVRAEEALKNADRRKDQFLATLAHELRNPLAPISNAMHLLRHPDGRRTADRVVEMVERQVRQMVRLVDDLMEVSRITRGKIELNKAPALLTDILASAVEASQPMIDQAGHELTVSLPEEPLILDADWLRLTQVFTNLLNNAAKYTDAGGHIWLSARRDGNCAVVTVRDNGIGIPHDQLPHVFDMFAQVHREAGGWQDGLGIGLTMVRDLVRMHGGTVEACSKGPGQGSEFIVRLLLSRWPISLADKNATKKEIAAPLAGRRILIVDDNHDAADSLCMLLATQGAEVKAAYDGRSALLAVEGLRPHAMVLDIGMPGMNGYDVAQRIRQEPRFSGMQIIALTGWGQQADRVRSRISGVNHHLTKPLDLKILEDLLAGR